MTGEADALKGVQRAAKRRQRAEAAKRDANIELRERMREAQAAGAGVSQIARAAGLSRQGVYDLLADRRPS